SAAPAPRAHTEVLHSSSEYRPVWIPSGLYLSGSPECQHCCYGSIIVGILIDPVDLCHQSIRASLCDSQGSCYGVSSWVPDLSLPYCCVERTTRLSPIGRPDHQMVDLMGSSNPGSGWLHRALSQGYTGLRPPAFQEPSQTGFSVSQSPGSCKRFHQLQVMEPLL